ncbi:MAG: glycosyltransferase 87 family protein, partial [Cyclobacteriaceae bacterium]
FTAIADIHSGITREESVLLFSTFAIGVAAYLALSRMALPWLLILGAGIVARLVLFGNLPTLSDDFYRFIWDGRLLLAGISSFAELPAWYMQEGNSTLQVDASLFELLNSPNYYTVYPPISQFTFWLSAALSSSIAGSAFVIRLIIFGSEVANFFLIRSLLISYQKPASLAALYFLNPLVILELTGNLHFEGIMLSFVLLAVLFHRRKKDIPVGLALAGGVATKLVPLALAPLFIASDPPRRWLIIGLSCMAGFIVLFTPIVDSNLIDGLQNSLSLFIQKFEFNASIYYLAREVGFWVKGYNIIETLGPALTKITVALILAYAFLSRKNNNLAERMMWVWMIYLALALIVHPWYCIPMVGLCLFTKYRFPIYWSGLIFLSYLGYDATGYTPPFFWIIAEYVGLYFLMTWEIKEVQTNVKVV